MSCLQSLMQNSLPPGHELKIFLTDDGSTDGTSEAVCSHFPQVKVIQGDGQLYWGGGTNLAMKAALSENCDFYLWVNDDVIVYRDAIANALSAYYKWNKPCIIVGAMKEPLTGEQVRGGADRLYWWHPVKFKTKTPSNEVQQCDTIFGSFTLIPRSIIEVLGGIDEKFRHQLGDFDYGLRAAHHGFSLVLIPGCVGECSENLEYAAWKSKTSLSEAWQAANTVKGFPAKDWWVYCRRHAGPFWIAFFAGPYIKQACKIISRRYTRSTQ